MTNLCFSLWAARATCRAHAACPSSTASKSKKSPKTVSCSRRHPPTTTSTLSFPSSTRSARPSFAREDTKTLADQPSSPEPEQPSKLKSLLIAIYAFAKRHQHCGDCAGAEQKRFKRRERPARVQRNNQLLIKRTS